MCQVRPERSSPVPGRTHDPMRDGPLPTYEACAGGERLWPWSMGRVYGIDLWQKAMALAKELCHAGHTGLEALGDQREVDR